MNKRIYIHWYRSEASAARTMIGFDQTVAAGTKYLVSASHIASIKDGDRNETLAGVSHMCLIYVPYMSRICLDVCPVYIPCVLCMSHMCLIYVPYMCLICPVNVSYIHIRPVSIEDNRTETLQGASPICGQLCHICALYVSYMCLCVIYVPYICLVCLFASYMSRICFLCLR